MFAQYNIKELFRARVGSFNLSRLYSYTILLMLSGCFLGVQECIIELYIKYLLILVIKFNQQMQKATYSARQFDSQNSADYIRSMNAFNQSLNMFYNYSEIDVTIICEQLFKIANHTTYKLAPILTENTFGQLIEKHLQLKGKSSPQIAIIYHSAEWTTISINFDKQFGSIILRHSPIESKTLKIIEGYQKTCILEPIISIKSLLISQFTKPIYALNYFEKILNKDKEIFINGRLQYILKNRIHYGQVYLNSVKNSKIVPSIWNKAKYQQKRKLLINLAPLSQAQFIESTSIEERFIDLKINELFQSAFQQLDFTLLKIIYRSEVGPSFIRNNQGEIVPIPILIAKQRENQPSNKSFYDKVQMLLMQYGIWGNTDMENRKRELKDAEYKQIILATAKINKVPHQLFSSFFELLQKCLIAAINILETIASGHFSSLEKNSTKSTIDTIANLIFSKIPVVGSTVCSLYNSIRESQRIDEADRLHKKLPVDIPSAVKDFAIRVIRQYGEQIKSPIKKSALLELKRVLKEKWRQLFKDNSKKYEFDGVNYTLDWGILCHIYISKFFDFLQLQKANDCAVTIGIRAAHHSFEYHTLTGENLEATIISKHFQHKNCHLFLKLCSFITEISSYPSFISNFPDVFWYDSEVQAQKIMIKVKALILAKRDKIIMVFLADGDQINLKCKQTKKFKGIQISKDIHRYYCNFVDFAIFKQAGSNAEYCLGKIIELLLAKYPQAIIFTTGFQLGGTFSSLTNLTIRSVTQKKRNVVIYNFDQVPSFHRYQLARIFQIYSHYNQMKIIKYEDRFERDQKQQSNFIHLKQNFVCSQLYKDKMSVRDYLQVIEQKYSQSNKNKENKLQIPKQNQILDENEMAITNYESYQTVQGSIKNLCEAAIKGNYPLVRYLVEVKKVRINDTCLQVCQKQGYLTTPLSCSLSLNCKTNVSTDDKVQYEQKKKIVKYLVNKGADLTFRERIIQGSFISRFFASIVLSTSIPMNFKAVQTGDLQLLKYLVSKGLNLYEQVRIGLTNYNALSAVLQSQNLQIIEYLIQQKGFQANGNKFIFPKGQIANYLVSKGANVNSSSSMMGFLMTNMISQAVSQNNYKFAKYLAEKGASLQEIPAEHKGTALHIAAENLNLRMFKMLLENGANLYAKKRSVVTMFNDLGENKKDASKTSLDLLMQQANHPLVNQYLIVLVLQGRINNESFEFAEFIKIVDSLLNYMSLFTLLSYLVSQVLYYQSKSNQQNTLAQLRKNRNNQFYENKTKLFEGDHIIQIFSNAIRYMYMYSDPQRFEKIINICESNEDDTDFLFLQGLAYLQQTVGASELKKEFYKNKIENILLKLPISAQSLYLQGQMRILDQKYDEALEGFNLSLLYNQYFYHSSVKSLKLIAEKGDFLQIPDQEKFGGEKFKQKVHQIAKIILPIDLEAIMEDIYELMETQSFLKKGVEPIEQQSFQKALKSIFVIDALKMKQILLRLLPQKIYHFKMKCIFFNEEIFFSAKSVINSIDYAYDLLSDFGASIVNRVFKAQSLPENRNHDFFKKITKVVQMLKILSECISNKCTKSDFDERDYQDICLKSISNLIYYYQQYIDKVVTTFLSDQDRGFANNFFGGQGKDLDVKQNIKVYAQRHLLLGGEINSGSLGAEMPYLLRRFASLSLTITPPESGQIYGTHRVVILPESGKNQAYYKYEPYAPGVEFAVSSLFGLILQNTTPQTLLIKLVSGNQNALYLASKAITGRNFAEVINHTQVIRAIDMKNFSSLFISSFLVCTGDSKPDNFVLHFNYDNRGLVSTELISIDNDIAFYRNRLQLSKEKKVYSDMLNILYLMPQMDEPISPYLHQYLLKQENQPQIIVAKWLLDLQKKNQTYLQMQGFTQEDLIKLKLPIKLPKGTAGKVYSTLRKIIAVMRTPSITHAQIFEVLAPSLAYFYNKQRDPTSMVNSLKNIYIAAGANPELVGSLYSFNKIMSSRAWNTLSASKRRNNMEFNKLFNSSIAQQARDFISCINFEGKNQIVVAIIGQKLSFAKKVIIKKAASWQIKILKKSFLQLEIYQQNTSKNELISDEGIKITIMIFTIWDLLEVEELPSNDMLMASIIAKQIDINELNSEKQTVLFQAVKLAKKDYKRSQKLIKLLMDCGIDINRKNNQEQTILDFIDKQAQQIPEIILLILDHQPTYLQQLIRSGQLNEAEAIALSMNSQSCLQIIQSQIDQAREGESSILRQMVSNRKYKNLLMITLSRLKHSSICQQLDILQLFVQNYADSDFDAFDLLLGFFHKVEQQIPKQQLSNFMNPCNIAFEKQKLNLLVRLLNSGHRLSNFLMSQNIRVVSLVAEYAIKIDLGDLTHQYDYAKVNSQGKTLFHLMAQAKDKRILSLLKGAKEIIDRYKKDLKCIAIQVDFVELMEIICTQQQLETQLAGEFVLLIRNEKDKQLAKLLKRNGFSFSISDARRGIDLFSKIDEDKNTLLIQLALKYIHSNSSDQSEIIEEIQLVIGYCSPVFVNFTLRSDGNTALHLAARAANIRLIELFLQHGSFEECIFNAQGKRPVDLVKDNMKKLFKNNQISLLSLLNKIQQNTDLLKLNSNSNIPPFSSALSQQSAPFLLANDVI